LCQQIVAPGGTIVKSGKIDATRLITHHFKFSEILEAYETFAHAAETKALKVIVSA
jgi:alcohol dehydrogenase